MISDQIDKLNEQLALIVMGWRLGLGDYYYTAGETTRTLDSVHVQHWQPARCWADAGRVLEVSLKKKRFRLNLVAYPEGFTTWINNNSGEGDIDACPDSGPFAISLAIAKAYNIEIDSL